jgi:hypothetical protein
VTFWGTAKILAIALVGAHASLAEDLVPSHPLEGSVILNDGQLRYMLTDRTYVKITTQTYKDGELRGHIKRQHPPATQ